MSGMALKLPQYSFKIPFTRLVVVIGWPIWIVRIPK
jgi:hypothetical protein